MLSVNPPLPSSGTPLGARLSMNPFSPPQQHRRVSTRAADLVLCQQRARVHVDAALLAPVRRKHRLRTLPEMCGSVRACKPRSAPPLRARPPRPDTVGLCALCSAVCGSYRALGGRYNSLRTVLESC